MPAVDPCAVHANVLAGARQQLAIDRNGRSTWNLLRELGVAAGKQTGTVAVALTPLCRIGNDGMVALAEIDGETRQRLYFSASTPSREIPIDSLVWPRVHEIAGHVELDKKAATARADLRVTVDPNGEALLPLELGSRSRVVAFRATVDGKAVNVDANGDSLLVMLPRRDGIAELRVSYEVSLASAFSDAPPYVTDEQLRLIDHDWLMTAPGMRAALDVTILHAAALHLRTSGDREERGPVSADGRVATRVVARHAAGLRVIGSRAWIDRTMTVDGVEVVLSIDKSDSAHVDGVAAAARAALEHRPGFLGAFPWSRVRLVQAEEVGDREALPGVPLVVLSRDDVVRSAVVARRFELRRRLFGAWFGATVPTSRSGAHARWHETLARYCAVIDWSEARAERARWQRLLADVDWSDAPLDEGWRSEVRSGQAALVLTAIEDRIGLARLGAALRRLITERAGKSTSWGDVIATLARELDGNTRQWLEMQLRESDTTELALQHAHGQLILVRRGGPPAMLAVTVAAVDFDPKDGALQVRSSTRVEVPAGDVDIRVPLDISSGRVIVVDPYHRLPRATTAGEELAIGCHLVAAPGPSAPPPPTAHMRQAKRLLDAVVTALTAGEHVRIARVFDTGRIGTAPLEELVRSGGRLRIEDAVASGPGMMFRVSGSEPALWLYAGPDDTGTWRLSSEPDQRALPQVTTRIARVEIDPICGEARVAVEMTVGRSNVDRGLHFRYPIPGLASVTATRDGTRIPIARAGQHLVVAMGNRGGRLRLEYAFRPPAGARNQITRNRLQLAYFLPELRSMTGDLELTVVHPSYLDVVGLPGERLVHSSPKGSTETRWAKGNHAALLGAPRFARRELRVGDIRGTVSVVHDDEADLEWFAGVVEKVIARYQQVGLGLPFSSLSVTAMPGFAQQPANGLVIVNDGDPYVLAHEMAHGWFGSIVLFTPGANENAFLHETLAEYTSSLLFTGDKAVLLRADWARRTAADAAKASPVAILAPRSTSLEHAKASELQYGKGPLILYQLESRNGRAAMVRLIHALIDRYRGRNLGWQDLVKTTGDVLGREHADWLHAWLEHPGAPSLAVANVQVERDKIQVVLDHEAPPASVVVDVEVLDQAGKVLARAPVTVAGTQTRIALPASNGATRIVVDRTHTAPWRLPKGNAITADVRR